jgi:hypothetical protein
MADERTDESGEGAFEIPAQPPPQERSLELPAVIIGDRGQKEAQPRVRLLPGRVPESVLLFPAYTLVGIATLIAGHFAVTTGEWNLLVTLLGWGLLLSWYWVYGVTFRYRRLLMKLFALVMSGLTAGSLTFVSAVRAGSLRAPAEGVLVVREAIWSMTLCAGLTGVSLVLILSHAVYFGRGYREKRDRGTTRPLKSPPPKARK